MRPLHLLMSLSAYGLGRVICAGPAARQARARIYSANWRLAGRRSLIYTRHVTAQCTEAGRLLGFGRCRAVPTSALTAGYDRRLGSGRFLAAACPGLAAGHPAAPAAASAVAIGSDDQGRILAHLAVFARRRRALQEWATGCCIIGGTSVPFYGVTLTGGCCTPRQSRGSPTLRGERIGYLLDYSCPRLAATPEAVSRRILLCSRFYGVQSTAWPKAQRSSAPV